MTAAVVVASIAAAPLRPEDRIMKSPAENGYSGKIAREAQHWGDHLQAEAVGQRDAWLDHPLILQHYRQRSLIDGLRWEEWVARQLGGSASRSLDLGCGSGARSLALFADGRSRSIDGLDVSEARLDKAEERRRACGAPGAFRMADINQLELPATTYDLIFSCHSFHHFFELERIMQQVEAALTPNGYFVLEEFVGPTQFQWTDQQIAIVKALTTLLPGRLRTFRWGDVKTHEGRPTPKEVAAVSPFESIRSAEIAPLFARYFQTVAIRRLGGTLQHLLYNGIIHDFASEDDEACRAMQAIWTIEDALIDADLLPSDFGLLIGRRRPPSLHLPNG